MVVIRIVLQLISLGGFSGGVRGDPVPGVAGSPG